MSFGHLWNTKLGFVYMLHGCNNVGSWMDLKKLANVHLCILTMLDSIARQVTVWQLRGHLGGITWAASTFKRFLCYFSWGLWRKDRNSLFFSYFTDYFRHVTWPSFFSFSAPFLNSLLVLAPSPTLTCTFLHSTVGTLTTCLWRPTCANLYGVMVGPQHVHIHT